MTTSSVNENDTRNKISHYSNRERLVHKRRTTLLLQSLVCQKYGRGARNLRHQSTTVCVRTPTPNVAKHGQKRRHLTKQVPPPSSLLETSRINGENLNDHTTLIGRNYAPSPIGRIERSLTGVVDLPDRETGVFKRPNVLLIERRRHAKPSASVSSHLINKQRLIQSNGKKLYIIRRELDKNGDRLNSRASSSNVSTSTGHSLRSKPSMTLLDRQQRIASTSKPLVAAKVPIEATSNQPVNNNPFDALTSSNNQYQQQSYQQQDDEISSTLLDWIANRCIAQPSSPVLCDDAGGGGKGIKSTTMIDARSKSTNNKHSGRKSKQVKLTELSPAQETEDMQTLVFSLRKHALGLIELEQRYRAAVLGRVEYCRCGRLHKSSYSDELPPDGEQGMCGPEICEMQYAGLDVRCKCNGEPTDECNCPDEIVEPKPLPPSGPKGIAKPGKFVSKTSSMESSDNVSLGKSKNKLLASNSSVESNDDGRCYCTGEPMDECNCPMTESDEASTTFSLVSAGNRQSTHTSERVESSRSAVISPIMSAYRTKMASQKEASNPPELHKKVTKSQPDIEKDSYTYQVDIHIEPRSYKVKSPTVMSVSSTDSGPVSVRDDAKIKQALLSDAASESGPVSYLDHDIVLHKIPTVNVDKGELKRNIMTNLREDLQSTSGELDAKPNLDANINSSSRISGAGGSRDLSSATLPTINQNTSSSGHLLSIDDCSTMADTSSSYLQSPISSSSLSESLVVNKQVVNKSVQDIVFNGSRYRITVSPIESRQSQSQQRLKPSSPQQSTAPFSIKKVQTRTLKRTPNMSNVKAKPIVHPLESVETVLYQKLKAMLDRKLSNAGRTSRNGFKTKPQGPKN